MRHLLRLHCALIVWTVMSGAAMACAYPHTFRLVNNTLTEQLDRGGEVGVFVRATLRRALDHMPPDVMLTSMAGDIRRGDLRAARRVLEAADALADGRGLKVDPDLRADTSRLNEAVELECSNGVQSASGTGEATSVEGGGARRDGGVGSSLTFEQGMARLSIAFTLYAVFLVALFTFRQLYHRRLGFNNRNGEDVSVPVSGPLAKEGTQAGRSP